MLQEQTATAHIDDVFYEVVTKIAEVEDGDPLEVTPPLYDAIDPDALDQIFATSSTTDPMDTQVTFSYNGYEVTVRGDGDVSVAK